MKRELYELLKQINPCKNGIPINTGNCQWCAIEGVRAIFQGIKPSIIPSNKGGGVDPIEERIHPIHRPRILDSFSNFKNAISSLKEGEVMLASLETPEFDHAFIIYKDPDDDKELFLIDPDRGIIVEIDKQNDFIQKVRGWEGIQMVNYSNGDIFSAEITESEQSKSLETINLTVCILNKSTLQKNPLPVYGSKIEGDYDDEEGDEEWVSIPRKS